MRLILTTDHSAAESLKRAGLADIVLSFGFRFVWGPLPSAAELATLLAPRSAKHVNLPAGVEALLVKIHGLI